MRSVIIVTAAAAAVSGFGLAAVASPTTVPTTAPSAVHVMANDAKPAAFSEDGKANATMIRNTIAEFTSAAVTPRSMARLVSYLDAPSRQRIEKSATASQDYGNKLDAEMEAFDAHWKQKYGHDFDISMKNAADIFTASSAPIEQGTCADNPKLAAEVMKAAGQTAAPSQSKSANNAAPIALMNFKGTSGHPDLQVPMVCERSVDWRIQAPTALTAQKLRDNLQTELGNLDAHSAQWPTNENHAYRQVARHVLMAVMDRTTPPQHAATDARPAHPAARTNPPAAKATPASTTTTHWWQFWHWF